LREEGRLLVNDADAEGAGEVGGVVGDVVAVDAEGSAVWGQGAGDDLDECGFAGSVFADDGVDFAGAEVEVGVFQGLDAGERFGDGSRFDERARFWRGHGRKPKDIRMPQRGRACSALRDMLQDWDGTALLGLLRHFVVFSAAVFFRRRCRLKPAPIRLRGSVRSC
jgi:hypothetical protein